MNATRLKKTLILGLAGLLSTSVAALAQAAKPSFIHDGQLTVCTTAGFPPMTYIDKPSDPSPVGIDIDVADALGEFWGAQVKFVTSGFDGLLPSLQAGRCSLVISGIYLSEKRRQSYDGVPYMRSTTVIVAKTGTDDIKAPEDLSGKRLAIEAGTSYADIPPELNKTYDAGHRPHVTFQTYESQVAAMQQVMLGRADATLTEQSEAGVRIKQTDGQVKIVYTYPSTSDFGIYIQKNQSDLTALRTALKALQKQGTFKVVSSKYNFPEGAFGVDFDS